MTTIEILYHMVCHHVILSYAMLHRRCREEEKDQVRRSRERERESEPSRFGDLCLQVHAAPGRPLLQGYSVSQGLRLSCVP